MIESSNWILDSIELQPNTNSEKLGVKLYFKKMRHQFPITNRWQELCFVMGVDERQYKKLCQGVSYTLYFNEELICINFRPD